MIIFNLGPEWHRRQHYLSDLCEIDETLTDDDTFNHHFTIDLIKSRIFPLNKTKPQDIIIIQSYSISSCQTNCHNPSRKSKVESPKVRKTWSDSILLFTTHHHHPPPPPKLFLATRHPIELKFSKTS